VRIWRAQWKGPFLTGAIVVAIASVFALMTTASTIAVNRYSDNRPSATAPAKATSKATATPRPRPTTQHGDGGEICNRFDNYAEAKRYYDRHPKHRSALSWDGDDRPCEDFIARWASRAKSG
jgi:hypothetical protein